MFPYISELLKHSGALIAVIAVVGVTLFYFSYRIYRGREPTPILRTLKYVV